MKSELWNNQIGFLYMKKPIVVTDDQDLAKVVELMQKENRGSILVKDAKGHLCGTFTTRDALGVYVDTDVPGETPIGTVINRDEGYLKPETTVEEAIAFFVKKNVRHYPVCKSSTEIIGILPIYKLVDFMAEHFPAEVLNLPPESGVVSEGMEGA